MADIMKLEKELWEAADNLRANSKLTSQQYCMPVLGLIFLRYMAKFAREVDDQFCSGYCRIPWGHIMKLLKPRMEAA